MPLPKTTQTTLFRSFLPSPPKKAEVSAFDFDTANEKKSFFFALFSLAFVSKIHFFFACVSDFVSLSLSNFLLFWRVLFIGTKFVLRAVETTTTTEEERCSTTLGRRCVSLSLFFFFFVRYRRLHLHFMSIIIIIIIIVVVSQPTHDGAKEKRSDELFFFFSNK